jgi:TolB-like protein/predicted TPR repeat methyltransferase
VNAEKGSFLEELKRRHVVRVAIAYVVAGWLLVQVATQVFPFFNIPNWVVRLVVVVIVIGFPVAVAFAWVFELTPEGIRRTAPADSPEARAPQAHRSVGQKLNAIIVAMLVLAVAFLGWRLYAVRHVSPPVAAAAAAMPATSVAATSSAPAAQTVPAKSIAVLPFENLNVDEKDAYFVAGMQDLILTKLADIGDLKVISRTSTEKYKSHPDDLKTIGRQLGVATILEGSVQKAGNQVLINVQLIDTRSDSHIWAQAYTRTLTNVFGVEGDVAEKVATALKAKLSPAETARLASDLSSNTAANDAFLRAEYQTNQGWINYDTASWKAAIPLYKQAIAQAPDFALAYARLSYAQSQLAWFGGGGMNIPQLIAAARRNAEQALKLAPDLPAAQLAMGYSDYWGRGDYDAALKAFAAALKLRPNDADALAAQGYVQRRQARFDAAIASFQQALTLDPRNSALAFELGSTYTMVGRYPEAENAFQRALALDPHNLNAKVSLSSTILFATGDIPRALAAVQGDDPLLKLTRVSLLGYQRKYREALALLDTVPDTPDNFGPGSTSSGPKALLQAELYRQMGDMTRARPLYEKALPQVRAMLAQLQGVNKALQWNTLATVELGLGNTSAGIEAIAKSQATLDRSPDNMYGPAGTEVNAALYAEAHRPDLAVPLLAKALATPGIGYYYAPVMLWLDPAWDPIRHDPGFQALLKKYAKHKPAVIYPMPSGSVAAAPSS